jgi:Ca2+-binding EF-hand superfamily protein
MKRYAILILAFSLIISSLAAQRFQNKRKGMSGKAKERFEKRFNRRKDNKLSQPHSGPQKNQMQAAAIERLNKELENLKEKAPEKYKKAVKKYDLNSDGQIDQFEQERILVEKLTRNVIMKLFDQNQDGKLDDAEMKAFQKKHQENMENFKNLNSEMYYRILQKFDKNENKILDVDEWFKAMRVGEIPTPQLSGMRPEGPHHSQNSPRPGMPSHGFSGRHPMPGGPPEPQHTGQQPLSPPLNQQPEINKPDAKSPPVKDDLGFLEGIELDYDPSEDSEADNDFDFLDL